MSLRSVVIAGVLLLAACKTKSEKLDEKGIELKGEVYTAVCRFYVEEACTQQMQDEGCGFITFESVSDCKALISLSSSCDDELKTALAEAESDVNDCVAALDAFECGGSDPICVDQQDAYIWNLSGCEKVNEIFAEHCPEDSGA